MKNPIRIALIQLAYSGSMDSMKAQYRKLIAEAAERGAELVCLPEFSLIPYFPGARQPEGFNYAESIPGGESERFFSEMAQQHKVHIVGSLYEEAQDGGLFDTATVHDVTGKLVGVTRKVHIPSGNGYHETDYYAGSDQFPVVKLDALNIATPTCYDQWYPELARIYALGGAELIVYPTAIGDEPEDHVMDTQDAWETVMRGHAIANGIFIAAINRVGSENGVTFYGSSFICAPNGQIIARASRDKTEVIIADIDPAAIKDWRSHFPLLHQRRPSVYQKILQQWSGDEKPDWMEETPLRKTNPRRFEMKNTRITSTALSASFSTLSLVLIPILILTACGSPSTPAAQTEAPIAESGCAQPSPKMEVTSKELNLFTWSEYIPDEIVKCFEEVYGVQINHDTFSSQGELLAKLSRGASGYDVVQPSDDMVQLMVEQDLFAELDHNKLTVMGNFNPAFLNPAFDPNNKYRLPYQGGSTGIIYNTETVKTPLTSYADLWNPDYAGRIIAVDDSRTMIAITLLALGYDANSTEPAQLSEVKAKLKELTANVRIFDSDSPKTALISGDADLGVIWSTEAFTTVIENPAFQYVYPKEGILLWQDNFAIMKDAPHADAAYAWLNYLYQPDVFWMVMRDHSGSNPDAAAVEYAKANYPEVYEAYIKSNIANVPGEAMTNGHWLKSLTPEDASVFDQLWTEVK